MKNRPDRVWQTAPVVQQYLESVRGAIPLAAVQIEVMMRLIAARNEPVQKFLDLGCGDGRLLIPAVRNFRAVATGIDAARSLEHRLSMIVARRASRTAPPAETSAAGSRIHRTG